jgi:hypothetical protein
MLNIISEINQTQADLIKSFAIFYLLLIGNYIGSSIFTCYQKTLIKTHKSIQLIFAFFLFYFLVTIVSDTGNLEYVPPIEKLLYSVFYFLLFLIVMRLDIRISGIVLVLIFIIYFLELNKDFYLDKGKQIDDPLDQETYNDNSYWFTLNWPIKIRIKRISEIDFKIINQIETFIYYIILFLLVIGFIAYGGEIKEIIRSKKGITWLDVIADTQICKMNIERKSFKHYLLKGLGISL